MLLGGGQLDGKRILSEESVRNLTHRQTPPALKDSYGLGFSVGETFFGHGGAYSTDSRADTGRGLIFVWLVQHAGFPGEGEKAQGAFREAAIKAFAPPRGERQNHPCAPTYSTSISRRIALLCGPRTRAIVSG